MITKKIDTGWTTSGYDFGINWRVYGETKEESRVLGFKRVVDLKKAVEADKPVTPGLYRMDFHDGAIRFKTIFERDGILVDMQGGEVSDYTGVKSYTEIEAEA